MSREASSCYTHYCIKKMVRKARVVTNEQRIAKNKQRVEKRKTDRAKGIPPIKRDQSKRKKRDQTHRLKRD